MNAQLSFHNTIALSSPDHEAANKHASQQEAEILNFFKEHRGEMWTPCEISTKFPQWPITSVRRSITNLTTRGSLRKTSVKRVGIYGVENYCWEVI